jgi:peroxiredoxin 2/4
MKTKSVILSFIFLFSLILTQAQDQKDLTRIPLIGEGAPEFTAESTMGTIHFPSDYFAKWKILFSHPSDFTPVCSTELLELAALQDEFNKLNTAVVVISTDGLDSHIEWLRSLEQIKYKSREPIKIKFPLITDKGLDVSKKYGMIHSYTSATKDVRGVFIISPENKIMATFFYPFNVGRNMDEIVRTLTALQTADDKNILTPADWRPGDDVLIHNPKSLSESEKMAKDNNPDQYQVAWYIWFKKLK